MTLLVSVAYFRGPFLVEELPYSRFVTSPMTHHNSVLLFAGVLRLVYVVVTIAFVIGWYLFALKLAKPGQRFRVDDHLLEASRLLLRAVKHIRGVFVKNDALAHHVASFHRDKKYLIVKVSN